MEITQIDPRDNQLFGDWLRAMARTILQSPMSAEQTASRTARRITRGAGGRTFAAMDAGRVVGTFESFDADAATVVAPGAPGTAVQTHNISGITVAPTHRRRGLLNQWITAELRWAHERRVPLAALVASEAAIYGRYGFAPVVESVRWSVTTVTPAGLRPPERPCESGEGCISDVDDDKLRTAGPGVYDQARLQQPGAAPRDAYAWDEIRHPEADDRRPRWTFGHRDAQGTLDGYARVAVNQAWHDRAPANTVDVLDLSAVDARAIACLWRACLGIDLVVTVDAYDRPVGDPVAELLRDRRAAQQVARNDLYWWRILDVPAALTGRWWAGPGALVLDVVDPMGLAGGRWRLDVDANGQADVTPTTVSPDVTMGVDALARILAGQGSLTALAAAGWIDEHHPGAVLTLDRLAWAPSPAHATYTWF